MTFDVIAAASAVAASSAAIAADVVGIFKADFATAGVVFAAVVTLALALGAPDTKTSEIVEKGTVSDRILGTFANFQSSRYLLRRNWWLAPDHFGVFEPSFSLKAYLQHRFPTQFWDDRPL